MIDQRVMEIVDAAVGRVAPTRKMLVRDIRRGRRTLGADGWTVPERPSAEWLKPMMV